MNSGPFSASLQFRKYRFLHSRLQKPQPRQTLTHLHIAFVNYPMVSCINGGWGSGILVVDLLSSLIPHKSLCLRTLLFGVPSHLALHPLLWVHHWKRSLSLFPDEGYYQSGKFQFEIDVPEAYNMVVSSPGLSACWGVFIPACVFVLSLARSFALLNPAPPPRFAVVLCLKQSLESNICALRLSIKAHTDRTLHRDFFFSFLFFSLKVRWSPDLHNVIVLCLPRFFVHPSIRPCHTSVISARHSVCVSLCVLHALVCFSAHTVCVIVVPIVLRLRVTLTRNLSSARCYLSRLLPTDK